MYTGGWLNDKEAGGTAAAPLWYYFNTSTGKMLHGWLTYKGEKYYLGVPGDASLGLMYDKGYERPLASSSQLFAASDKYHVTNIQSDKSETIGSKFRLTTKMSAHHNLISGPDADISYNAVIKNGIEYYYDNAGRLTLVYTNQRKADNTGIQLSLPRLEEHAREFLSSNGIMMGKYNVSDVIQSVVGHQFIFEDDSKNLIYVSMYDNGKFV